MRIHKLLALGAAACVVALLGAAVVWAQGGSPGGGPRVDRWVISGGGGPASSGNVTFNDTLGQPVIGDASGGGSPAAVALRAGFWPCSASAAVNNVAAARLNNADARLTWSVLDAGSYDVWRGISPYFASGDPGSVQIGAGVTSPFTATAVLGNPATNYTFLVLAQNGCGASGPSNRTAEFDFSLTPGSS